MLPAGFRFRLSPRIGVLKTMATQLAGGTSACSLAGSTDKECGLVREQALDSRLRDFL
jgi:hypothetical protein